MAAPALQKTWQGGTTLGGTDLVNQLASGSAPRDVLFDIKQALTTFNANPWTVVRSSDGTTADGTDNWVTAANIIYHAAPGSPRSWIILKQAGIAANFHALVYTDDLAADPNSENIHIVCNEGGFGAAVGGADGSTTVLPTPSDTSLNFSVDGTDWQGAEAGAGTQKKLSCIQSTDGECTRIIVSQDNTGIPITAIGLEVPREPPAEWTNPAVIYMFKTTVASGLSCFRWEIIAVSSPLQFNAMVDNNYGPGKTAVSMLMQMPMFSTVEVIDLAEEGQPNPQLYPGSFYGTPAWNLTNVHHGTLFDWYWCSRNPAGAHLLDLDTIPVAGDRTLVCVGDCVWGWLNDSATDLQYGTQEFDYFAPDTTTLQNWLGIRGQVGTDIGEDSSHLYQMETGIASVDIGTLAAAAHNLGTPLDITAVTDSDFEDGARTVSKLGLTHVAHLKSGNVVIPSAMDGTKSFMVGGIMRIDSLPGVATFADILSNHRGSQNGWIFRARDLVSGDFDVAYLRFSIIQQNFTSNITASTFGSGVKFGQPFAFLAGLDVAAGNVFCMIDQNISPPSFTTAAWVDIGSFGGVTGTPTIVGLSPRSASTDTVEGVVAQLFSFEWSTAINANITQANMDRFAKACATGAP